MTFLTEKELNTIKGMIHTLTNLSPEDSDLSFEALITDSNGENVGKITYNGIVDAYVFEPATAAT